MKLLSLYLVVLSVALATAGCSRKTYKPSAEERGARLNRDKARAAELIEAGAYADAVTLLDELSAEATGDPQLFVMLGDARVHLGEWQPAVRHYESAIRLSYSSHEAHLKLATLLMQHEYVGRALTEFELAIRYGDRKPLTHYNYGLALREMGRPEEALREWRRAHEMDARDPRYAEAVGIGLTGVDDEEAVTHFEKALKLGADTPSFHNNYGLALQRLGHFTDAGSHFHDAVEGDGDSDAYRFNLAALYMRAGSFARAQHEWETMIERWGERWSYSVYLARARLSQGQYAEAIAAVEQMAMAHDAGSLRRDLIDRIPPRKDEAFEILALAYRGKGDLEPALRFMRRTVELDPDNLVYRNNYGVFLAENGMLAEARNEWRRVLEVDGDNRTARENLSRFGP